MEKFEIAPSQPNRPHKVVAATTSDSAPAPKPAAPEEGRGVVGE